MRYMLFSFSASSTQAHTNNPPRLGRPRGLSEKAVKALWQKRRPAAPLYAEASTAGFYIEGCSSLGAAAAASAELSALHPDLRKAPAAAHNGARSHDRQRGVLTKRKNKIETDLSRVHLHLLKPLPDKAL